MTGTLILSQCFLQTEEQGRLMRVCFELAQRLNPGYDVLLIDNASPIDPMPFLPSDPAIEIFRFPDAIGHFGAKFQHEGIEPRDGPGRAIMTGLRMAMDSGYDRLVSLESDALFARPFEEGFQNMRKPAAFLPRTRWGYLETNAMWFSDLKWLDTFGLIGKYAWEKQTKENNGPGNEGERQYERLLGEHLCVLNYPGGRGEGYINAKNLKAVFPFGCAFLTHVDRECYAEFLRMNGHNDLVENL